MVSFYYSEKIGQREKEEFERVFSQKNMPQDIPIYKVKETNIDLVEVIYEAKLVSSKNEGRRLLSQGGISLMNTDDPSGLTTLKDQTIAVPSGGLVIKVGKKKFLKIITLL
jgi:tyrosyl-tRNA synthetase